MEDIKCLIIGDPHFKVGDNERINIMCKNVINHAKKSDPDFIVILGDVFNDFENIKISVLRKFTDFLKELRKIASVYILVGNHDRPNNSEFCTKNHSLAAFEEWENVYVIDTTKEFLIKDQKFVFVPYVPPTRLIEALDLLGKDSWLDSLCIFGHQDIIGAKMGPKTCSEGDEWLEDYPLFISGHNHEYQVLQDNMFYPGNIYQLKYGDSTDKSISLITFCDDSWEEERLYTEVPCKIKMIVNVEEFLAMDKPDYDIVKIVIKDLSSNIDSIKKNKKMKEFIKDGIMISTIFLNDGEPQNKEEKGETDLELIERKVEDFDELLYERITNEDKEVKFEFKQIFPDIVKIYKKSKV